VVTNSYFFLPSRVVKHVRRLYIRNTIEEGFHFLVFVMMAMYVIVVLGRIEQKVITVENAQAAAKAAAAAYKALGEGGNVCNTI
jgi:hypothetical protein